MKKLILLFMYLSSSALWAETLTIKFSNKFSLILQHIKDSTELDSFKCRNISLEKRKDRIQVVRLSNNLSFQNAPIAAHLLLQLPSGIETDCLCESKDVIIDLLSRLSTIHLVYSEKYNISLKDARYAEQVFRYEIRKIDPFGKPPTPTSQPTPQE